jgi:hypothetical protein
MIRHGYYLGLLATEYRLLKDAGEDVSGVLNELYYALATINRLDLKAEEEIGLIYNYTIAQSKNGFLNFPFSSQSVKSLRSCEGNFDENSRLCLKE